MGVKRRAAVLLVLALPWALAFGPREALTVAPPEEEILTELQGLDPGLGRSGLGGGARVWYQGDWGYDLELRLSLDPAANIAAELRSEGDRRRLRAARRDAVFKALSAHARLWRAQAEERLGQARVRLAELSLEAARAKGMGPLDLEAAELDLAEAKLGLSTAREELAAAREGAEALGLVGPAEPGVLRFSLERPRPDRSARLALAAKRAKSQAAWRNLVAASAEARYQGAGVAYRLSAESRGPSVGVGISPPDPLTPEGEVSVYFSAEISLDPAAWQEARRAELEAELEEISLKRAEEERRRSLESLRRGAEGAWRRLLLTKQRLELAERRLRQTALRRERNLASPLALAEAEVARAQAEVSLASAWEAYIEAVYRYLNEADVEWKEEVPR